MSVLILQGDAAHLPIPDGSVDLIVTSPPYFGLRSYTDGGDHIADQVGAEPTPAEYLDALITCTAEWMRVLKPTGSIFVNLGDKYSQRTQTRRSSHQPGLFPGKFEEFNESWAERAAKGATRMPQQNVIDDSGLYVREKSLMGLPWRYAIRCIDDLGLILRAEIVWAKPNGLPESVRDRVRRSHEQFFHFTKQPRYFQAIDEIREQYSVNTQKRYAGSGGLRSAIGSGTHPSKVKRIRQDGVNLDNWTGNPLGKLPGSVWTIATSPLKVPPELAVDHFAAFPPALVEPIVRGWSPREVCTTCGEGRRPASVRTITGDRGGRKWNVLTPDSTTAKLGTEGYHTITGYACGCPDTTAPATPGVVLDPMGGTGTTALVADVLGRVGVSLDLSHDYGRIARWRVADEKQRAKVAALCQPPKPKRARRPKLAPVIVLPDQQALFGDDEIA